MMKYLTFIEKKTGGFNALLWSLISNVNFNKDDFPRVSGFPWQDLVKWQDIPLETSNHKYTKQYYIRVPNAARCLYKDILDYFKP